MGRSKDTRGRLVPLSVPLQTPQLSLLRSLRLQADQLSARIEKLVKLEEQLKELPDEPRWDALVPVPSSSSLAYARGNITNTNTVMVHFDIADGTEEKQADIASGTAGQGYWVEYSAKQARGVARRRRDDLKPKLDILKAAIAKAEGALSTEMGFTGGGINQNYELLNEEGLPFVEIQEFEEEDELPTASTSVLSAEPLPKFPTASRNASSIPNGEAPSQSMSAESTKPTSTSKKGKKSVSFAQKDEYEPSQAAGQTPSDDEHDLPVIASQKAAASAGLPGSKVAETMEVPSRQDKPVTSSFADATLKSNIVVKDSTKPPPILTAAERSARQKSRYDVAADFDGAEPKKVDLSAYLPRQLRGIPIAATFKGKARATDSQASASQRTPQTLSNSETNGELEYDEYDGLEDSDDPDYISDEDLDEESDEDNTHIDDILAMREAAMEYHAKRHALGAGAGTGPLGGFGQHDEFDEPGLTEFDKGGLPIVESYEDDGDGQRRPSRFRKSRLETAQMVIPELKPGDVDVTETILPGDSLGPFEDEETVEAGAHGTNDFKGMSKEEVETFLRYVKALETGEELQDLRVVAAGDAPPAVAAPLPMDQYKPPAVKETVKKSEGPSIRDSVVEKNAEELAAPPIVTPAAPADEQPKRVSRFRAARSGNA